jgi:hypothetical protein
MSLFSKAESALEAAMPLSQAVKATAPAAAKTQLDIVEDKLDWLCSLLNGVKTISVGVADEDIAALKTQIQTATDAINKLSAPHVVAPVVVTPVVAPTA